MRSKKSYIHRDFRFKNNMMDSCKQRLGVGLIYITMVVFGLTVLIYSPFSHAQVTIQNGIDVYSPDSKPFGLSYSDWTAKWWQWGLSIPKDVNPIGDKTGEYCDQEQQGPVWFLAGTFGGEAVRSCVIPEGKAILLAPMNAECSNAENPDLNSELELRECAKSLQDEVTQMEVTVNGRKIENLEKFRIQSPLFEVELPKNNVFGLSDAPTPTKAVSDGNWVFLKPLPIGNHTINSKGVAVDFTTTNPVPSFISDITYHLTVK